MDADVDEPNLAAEWLVTHRPTIPVLSSDQYGIILMFFACLYVNSDARAITDVPGAAAVLSNGRLVTPVVVDLSKVGEL